MSGHMLRLHVPSGIVLWMSPQPYKRVGGPRFNMLVRHASGDFDPAVSGKMVTLLFVHVVVHRVGVHKTWVEVINSEVRLDA